jgi:hypothetical protein
MPEPGPGPGSPVRNTSGTPELRNVCLPAHVRQERCNIPQVTDQPPVPPEPQAGEHSPGAQEGVFGRLPGTRPGVRSPRRQGAGAEPAAGRNEQAGPEERAAEQPEPATDSRPRAAAPPAGDRSEPTGAPTPAAAEPESGAGAERSEFEEGPGDGGEQGGVEELAWGGIAVAAEAATLGVRLLSRAMDAVRRPPDRG